VSEATRWTVENQGAFMFHVQDGLFFERNKETGAVRVVVLKPGCYSYPFEKDMIAFETTMTRDSFASVMASMSARGETAETWIEACKFLAPAA
jgi:hypothetical protein